MYKALYAFKSNDTNALTFPQGTLFTLIDNSKDTHWWLVQNGQGEVGYVPANYLLKDQSSFEDVMQSIDRAIGNLAETIQQMQKQGENTDVQKSNLQKLQRHRTNVVEEHRQELSHNISVHHKCQSSPNGEELHKSLPNEEELITSHSKVCGADESQENTTESSSHSEHSVIPKQLGSELIEKMRTTAGLSYKGSINALTVVFNHLKGRVPHLETSINSILETIRDEMENSSVDLTTDDAKRLNHIFEELSKCKDDSQQRSWFLHEDEHIIQNLLNELLSILNNANTDVCNAIIACEHFAAVETLVIYYQMETRLNLRILLLQVFGTICGLSSKIISELLNSVLPCELARDIQTDTQEIEKFCYSTLVLTMILSQGEPVPLQYYTQLNDLFIQYLLDNIEEPPASDTAGQVPDLMMGLILAFNLHFQLPNENPVMKVIGERGTAKILTEKLMLLVNRGDDPVRKFDHEVKAPNAVLKFLADIYSSPKTSNLLYTNDMKVLIDIIIRMLTDLSPGETLRTEYLSIMELILQNHNYADHCHRRLELENCFKKLYEEETGSDMDKRIVAQIWKALPNLFQGVGT